jgi:hypothetical protein
MLDLEDWARQMRELWTQRFDALGRVIEEEKRKGNAHEQD